MFRSETEPCLGLTFLTPLVLVFLQRLKKQARARCAGWASVHRLQALDRDVGVALGGRELSVAQSRLEIADVTAGVVHERRHGVAERDGRSPACRRPRR
jgi:hypothetical protein